MTTEHKTLTEQVQEAVHNVWDATKSTAAAATHSVQSLFISGQQQAGDAADKAGGAVKPGPEKTMAERLRENVARMADQADPKPQPESQNTLGDKASGKLDAAKEVAHDAGNRAGDELDKADRKLKPESEKTMMEKVSDSAKGTWETVKGTTDKAARTVQPDSEKTASDKAKDACDATESAAQNASTNIYAKLQDESKADKAHTS
ncbi:hypothetical protein DIPPA_08066 [Diplonema papillatum]|nr:hypothetical protein DIPPA_08066 [Diplonema papillatum]|eukprot:gene22676-34713_t